MWLFLFRFIVYDFAEFWAFKTLILAHFSALKCTICLAIMGELSDICSNKTTGGALNEGIIWSKVL
ncbi:hypothetical protein APE02nite_01060 [Alkalibacterium pelagium]|nr:hypothetical protein APE02nite_01060 [Alkalibacterium pelagium]